MATQFTVPLGFLATQNPADSTTYYTGLAGNSMNAASDTWAEGHFEFPVDGTITAVSYTFKVAGTLGSSEDVTIAVRVDDSSDIATIAVDFDVAFQTVTVTGLSQAVIAGTKVALKIVTPAWNPNPTTVSASAVLFLE